MARYRNERVGVYDTVLARAIAPVDGTPWLDYLQWLASGNAPDPYVAPAEPPETLAQAKQRKRIQIKADGLARLQAKLGAIRSFDDVQFTREFYLSIAPAARQPTATFQSLIDIYQAGDAALTQVNAAATIAQVDAVTVSWPT